MTKKVIMNTPYNRILTYIETKVDVLNSCSCLLSLNALSLSLAVDVCRATKHFELLLAEWQKCMPLGEANDVNFAMWGEERLSAMMRKVRKAYGERNVPVSQHIYPSESCVRFVESQQKVDMIDSSLEVLRQVEGDDVPIILMYSLRALSEVLLKIAEFLDSPTEELIAMSYAQWADNYKMYFQRNCHSEYKKWKLQFTQRTLQTHLQKRLKAEAESFKQMFMESDDDFDLIYDDDQQKIDIDGLSRFLFTHAERFGVSYITPQIWYSQELIALFDFVETWNLIQADLQPVEKEQKTHTKETEKADDKKIKQAIKKMKEEKIIKHSYDYAFVMMVMNAKQDLPHFDSPNSFLTYLNNLGIENLPSEDSLKKKNSATFGKYPSWTFNDPKGKDATETIRRINVANRFLSIYNKGEE